MQLGYKYSSVVGLLLFGVCIHVLGWFAKTKSFQALQVRDIEYLGVPDTSTDGLPEITRDQLNSQTPEEIRKLFQTSEVFYCYEDSALALEAMLCGCPVVFLPNEHFQQTLGAKELQGLGYAWGDSPEQLVHAKATVRQARERYLSLLSQAELGVKTFLENSQPLAENVPYTRPFAEGYITNPSRLQKFLDMYRFFRDVVQDQGLGKTIKIVVKRIRSGRLSLH